MKTGKELEDLKAISDNADQARNVACKVYDAARNACIGDYSDNDTYNAARKAYFAADTCADSAWDAYVTEKEKADKETNKMKTENKRKELKVAAWDAQSAEIEADDACEAAWAIYTDAKELLTAAHDAAQRAFSALEAYEAED